MTNSFSQFSAVAFDFDGTLADSFGAIACSVNFVRAGRGLQSLSEDEVTRHVGRGAEYLLTHAVPGGCLPEDLQTYRVHHPTVMAGLTRLLPGVLESLQALRRAGKKIGICSNKPRAFSRELVRDLKVAEYFDVVLGPEDVPAPKPAPDMILRAMHLLGVVKSQMLFIGDMTVDVQTARAAGVQVWAVATGCESTAVLEAAKPDRLLLDLQEFAADIS